MCLFSRNYTCECKSVKHTDFKNSSSYFARQYYFMVIECETCKKQVKISELEEHEEECGQPKCIMYAICGHRVNPVRIPFFQIIYLIKQMKKEKVCDPSCLLLY